MDFIKPRSLSKLFDNVRERKRNMK